MDTKPVIDAWLEMMYPEARDTYTFVICLYMVISFGILLFGDRILQYYHIDPKYWAGTTLLMLGMTVLSMSVCTAIVCPYVIHRNQMQRLEKDPVGWICYQSFTQELEAEHVIWLHQRRDSSDSHDQYIQSSE